MYIQRPLNYIPQSVINFEQPYYNKDKNGNQWPLVPQVTMEDINILI